MKSSSSTMSRRALLRGSGVAIALPLLDTMIPSSAAADTGVKRLQVFYMPNGIVIPDFVPKGVGAGYELSPILKPLEAHRDRFTAISGLAHEQATAKGDGPGDHGRSCAAYLTAVHPKKTEGYDILCGVSMDQVVAKKLGRDTQMASLELGIDPGSSLGSCDSGYSCSYTNTLSWRTPTTPLPVSTNPREVFERLFGDGDSLDPASREAQLRRKTSLIDAVLEDVNRLSGRIGNSDRHKVAEYLDSVRDIERRIQVAEKNNKTFELPSLNRPAGVPDSFEDHVKLMIDLQVLAMQADLTRVATFMIGRELSQRSYPELGVPDAHHSISHHGNDPEKLAKLTKINIHHMELLAYQLDRMVNTKDGAGTLLDRTVLLAGPSLGDSNTHDHHSVPVIVAGGGFKGNQHIAVEKGTPFSNVLVSTMNQLGITESSFGDSTGPLKALAA